MDFGFLNPVNWATGVGDFIKTDPDAFSILTGNLGKILAGRGENPFLTGLGELGAGLGYTGKLEKQAQSQQDFWKKLLGVMTGPEEQGPTSIKSLGGGKINMEFNTSPNLFNPTPSELKEAGGKTTGATGGASATAPFQPAGATTSAPQASKTSSDVLSALFQALSEPTPSLKWLTPEMAIQVMGQRQNQRQLANQFATAIRGQDITQGTELAKILSKHSGKIPVTINRQTGEMLYNPNNPDTYVTGPEFSTAQRNVSQYGISNELALNRELRDQVARFMGASDFQGLQPDAQETAIDITTKAQRLWDNRKVYGYTNINEAIQEASARVKKANTYLRGIPEAETDTGMFGFGGTGQVKPELITQTVDAVVNAYNSGASPQTIEKAIMDAGYDVPTIIGLVKTRLGVK